MTRLAAGWNRSLVLALLALGLLSSGLLGGCAKNQGASVNDLRLENEELRQSRSQLEAALAQCDQRYEALAAERSRLDGEIQRLSAENDQLKQRPANAATGFEGVSGVGVSRRGGEIVVEIAGDVLFDSGQVTLKADSKRKLDQIASVIRSRYGGNEVRIAGFTDSDPIRKSGWKTNERLSSERALAVEEYLATRGLDKNRMYSAAMGPAEPRATKRESRRVEIIILGAG